MKGILGKDRNKLLITANGVSNGTSYRHSAKQKKPYCVSISSFGRKK